MNIPLNEGYRLSADKYQYIVQQYKGMKFDKRVGKDTENWESLSYHKDIRSAITHHANTMIRTADIETLADALEKIKSVVAELTQALTPVFDVKLKGDKK